MLRGLPGWRLAGSCRCRGTACAAPGRSGTVAVVGDLQLVARLHVSGAGEVAAVNVSELALAQGAAPQELAEDRPQHGSHLLLVFETCART